MESEENIKPQLGNDDLPQILSEFYGFEGGTIAQMNGYDDLNFHCTGWRVKDNAHVTAPSPHGYTLKIINSNDSEDIRFQHAQTDLLIFLRKHGIPCPTPVKNKFGDYIFKENLPRNEDTRIKRKEHVIKMLEFQPGTLFRHVPNDYSLYYDIGKTAAELGAVLKKFRHSAFDAHESIWHMTMVPKVRSYTHLVRNAELRHLLESFLEDFVADVVPDVANASDKQIIHGDLNNQNLICRKVEGEWKISAVIDFADSHVSYPLYEIAISMCYVMVDCKEKKLDPYVGSGHALAGYKNAWNAFNFDFLRIKQCLAARLCQSYVLATRTLLSQPENAYISENLELYGELLTEISKTPMHAIQDIWSNIINSYNTRSV